MKRIVAVIWVFVMVISLFGCKDKSSKSSAPAIHLTVISPTTGKVISERDISTEGDSDNNLRQALGMPTKEEEAKVAQYLSAEQLTRFHAIDCVYIKKHGSSAFTDFEAKMWTGINYNGVLIPALEYLPNGMVKTIVRDISSPDEHKYRIVYFGAENVTINKKETEWYREKNEFGAEVPELCPLPAD